MKVLPADTVAVDVDPRYPGIRKADFLNSVFSSDREIVTIGNPPFGKNASMAIKFFNHAASFSKYIAFVLPRSCRKTGIVNRLDRAFHLIHDKNVPDFVVLFEGKPHNVRTTFQVWERRDELRELIPVETSHPDFELTDLNHADFAIQRVGVHAGKIHHDSTERPTSHYFIRDTSDLAPGTVESIMRQLDYASVVGNVAAVPSLAKSELISMYTDYKSLISGIIGASF